MLRVGVLLVLVAVEGVVVYVEGEKLDDAVAGELGVDAQYGDQDADRDDRPIVRPAWNGLKEFVPPVGDVAEQLGQLVQLDVEPGRLTVGASIKRELPVEVVVEGASGTDVTASLVPAHPCVTRRLALRAGRAAERRDA